MTTFGKVVELAAVKPTPSLAKEHADACGEVERAERAWEARPSDARWKVVEDARRKRDQLAVRLRAAQERDRADAEKRAKEERASKERELLETRVFLADGWKASAQPTMDRIAALAVELASAERELRERHREIVEAANREHRLAAGLGVPRGQTAAPTDYNHLRLACRRVVTTALVARLGAAEESRYSAGCTFELVEPLPGICR